MTPLPDDMLGLVYPEDDDADSQAAPVPQPTIAPTSRPAPPHWERVDGQLKLVSTPAPPATKPAQALKPAHVGNPRPASTPLRDRRVETALKTLVEAGALDDADVAAPSAAEQLVEKLQLEHGLARAEAESIIAKASAEAKASGGGEFEVSITRRGEEQKDGGNVPAFDAALNELSTSELEDAAGVTLPRLPSQVQVDDDSYSNFLKYAITQKLDGRLATSLATWLADQMIGYVGTELDVDAMARDFRARFARSLDAGKLDLLEKWYRTEVLEQPPPSGRAA